LGASFAARRQASYEVSRQSPDSEVLEYYDYPFGRVKQ